MIWVVARLWMQWSRHLHTNKVLISGVICLIEPLRHTPAGIALIRLRLKHLSEQMEAGHPRQVECEMGCVGIGEVATTLSVCQIGDTMKVRGFLAKKDRWGTQIVLHITDILLTN